jgi:hypothetical protein
MADFAKVPRDFRCPRCGAQPHEGCETPEGLAWADHAERIEVARAEAKRSTTLGARGPRGRSPRRGSVDVGRTVHDAGGRSGAATGA